VRRTCQVLQQTPDLLLIFMMWDTERKRYRFLSAEERGLLASYDGPTDGFSRLFNGPQSADWSVENAISKFNRTASPILFLPEVVLDGQFPERLLWAAANELPTTALLHDLIPVTHMPFCAYEVVSKFREYLEALACVDALWAVSGESLREFERYVSHNGLPLPSQREVIWLPGQFASEPRSLSSTTPVSADEPLLVLCVGSIEPRKNHRNLIEAFRSLFDRRADMKLRLVLLGHRFAEADDLIEWLEEVVRIEPRITWTGLLSDTELGELYRRADFTVYPSLVEGFGLPVMESLWMGRPCLCHCDGVMAELAAQGGCLTADMSSPIAIARALERLADEVELRQRLAREAREREIGDWSSYAAKIGTRIKRV
jgi:glycosyltransferase involved in cell wall biosynthesis